MCCSVCSSSRQRVAVCCINVNIFRASCLCCSSEQFMTSMLQCVAVRSSMVLRFVVCFSALQRVAVCCRDFMTCISTTNRNASPANAMPKRYCSIILQHPTKHCNTLQRIATHCNALQRTTMHCNALKCTEMH